MKEVEKQTIEWKESWHDEYLKWICGYANAYGGTLYIGKDDDGHPVSGVNTKELLTKIPDKVISTMGIVPDVDVDEKDGISFIVIKVEKYPTMISYRGKYYYRTGSTMRELTGVELDKRLLQAQGRSWDSVPVQDLTIRKLSHAAINLFRDKAVEQGRLSRQDVNVSDAKLLEKLHVLTKDGQPSRAAMLAFHPDPERWITGSYIKIGFFGKSDADLQYQDSVHGPLIEQVDKTMDLVYTKYMKALIDYKGIQRIEQFMFPYEAFRELLINAVVHKDYSSCNPIQISIYENQIYIWNNAEMPDTLSSAKKLYQKHTSIPYNPQLAEVFFKSGMIEAWGRSFEKISEACKQQHAPLPELDISDDGIMVHCLPCKRYVRLLSQNANTKTGTKTGTKTSDASLAKTETEKKLLKLISADPAVTIQHMSEKTGLSKNGVRYALNNLRERGVVVREGTRKEGQWVIRT